MYYLHVMGVKVGETSQSTYFVDKCFVEITALIKKAIREDFLGFDHVTQSYPDFCLAADGLTDQEKTGEAVILTNLPVFFKVSISFDPQYPIPALKPPTN